MFEVQEYWAIAGDWATYSTHDTFAEAERAMYKAVKFHKHDSFRVVATK